jgi:hypothetical protein
MDKDLITSPAPSPAFPPDKNSLYPFSLSDRQFDRQMDPLAPFDDGKQKPEGFLVALTLLPNHCKTSWGPISEHILKVGSIPF